MSRKVVRSKSDKSTTLRAVIGRGIDAIRSAGPVGWIAAVALGALILAGVAINAIVVIVTTLKG